MAAFLANFAHSMLTFIAWVLNNGQLESSPSLCLQTVPSITALVMCLDKFTVPHAYYSEVTYDLAQPVGTQRQDWGTAVRSLLSVDGNCSITSVPLSLKGLYAIEPFQKHCIMYETASRCGKYLKGWGYMVVPDQRAFVSRNVHMSAPHPQYDLGTVEQAASVFESTGSKSLLIPGRQRTAFLQSSGCVEASSKSSQNYYRTDPAHNNLEPFFDASVSIRTWQNQHNGCPSSTCGFLQFHGKGFSTCSSDDIFLSSGLGNSAASKAWYTDDTDRPLKRLERNLRNHFPAWNVSMPSVSDCPLTATKNVVGRHLNGIPLGNVCSKAATTKTATGEFLHAEQGRLARSPQYYEAWSMAIRDTFDVDCAEGMILDSSSKLCAIAPKAEDFSARSARHVALTEPHKWNGPWYFFMSFLTIFYHV